MTRPDILWHEWDDAVADGHALAARGYAIRLLGYLHAGTSPAWTHGQRLAFESWCADQRLTAGRPARSETMSERCRKCGQQKFEDGYFEVIFCPNCDKEMKSIHAQWCRELWGSKSTGKKTDSSKDSSNDAKETP